MVLDAGREQHHRLCTMSGHLAKVGRSLDSSVAAFNESVGSLQSRVMVTARKFEDLGLTATQLGDVEQLRRRARTREDSEMAELDAPSAGLTGRRASEGYRGG